MIAISGTIGAAGSNYDPNQAYRDQQSAAMSQQQQIEMMRRQAAAIAAASGIMPQRPEEPSMPTRVVQKRVIHQPKPNSNQNWLKRQFKKNPKGLLGKFAYVVFNDDGSLTNDTTARIIVKVKGKTFEEAVLSLQHDDFVASIPSWRLETPDSDSELDKNLFSFTHRVSNYVVRSRANIDSNIAYLKKSNEEYKAKIKRQEESIGQYTNNRASTGIKTVENMKNLLKLLKHHDKVEDAYVSRQGNLIVISKFLYAIDDNDKENKKKEIGRILMRITYSSGSSPIVQSTNLDFVCNDHPHPHINYDGETCWGNNRDQVNQMLQLGLLYEFVDFAITFYSVYPQPTGSPYIGYDQWMNEKMRHEGSNLMGLKEEKA